MHCTQPNGFACQRQKLLGYESTLSQQRPSAAAVFFFLFFSFLPFSFLFLYTVLSLAASLISLYKVLHSALRFRLSASTRLCTRERSSRYQFMLVTKAKPELSFFPAFFFSLFSFRAKHLPNIPNPDLVLLHFCKDTKTPPCRFFKTRRAAPSFFSFIKLYQKFV